MVSKSEVVDFLAQKRMAVVGVSRRSTKFGNVIYQELKNKGYQVYAVNPKLDTFAGEPCYASLKDIPEPVDGVVLVVSPVSSDVVVKEAKEVGISRIWMQYGAKSVSAIQYCQENNMTVIADQCILMFLEPVTSIHKFHRWLWKIFGKLPK